MRIAYVEDNPTNLALVERIARMTQHKVVSYTEGEIALQELQHEKYDLILMDIELAGTVSGLEVVRILREYGLRTPIIAVTAYAMMGDRDKCLAAGCDDYLPKPLPITDFLALLAKYDALLQAPVPASVQLPAAPVPASVQLPVSRTPAIASPRVSLSDTHPSRATGPLPPLPTNVPPAVPAVRPPAPPVPAPTSTQPAAPAAKPPASPVPAPTSAQPVAPAVTPPVPPAPAPASAQPVAPAVTPPVPPAESQPPAPPVAATPAQTILPPAGTPPPAAKETADNGQRPAGTQEASTSSNAANAQPPAASKEIRMPAHPVDPDEKRTI